MNKCLECNTTINHSRKFCNSSCAAKFNNRKRSVSSRLKQKQTIRTKFNSYIFYCLLCNKDFTKRHTSTNKYCSVACQHKYEWELKKVQIEAGLVYTRNVLKKYVSERDGYKCVECGIQEWNDKHITLQLEHKDGNSDNNLPNNLCLLCPNCHSQTPTHSRKIKNKLKDTIRNNRIRKAYAEGRWRT